MRPIYIQINEQKIAYYQTKQDGLPVVFIHGNSLSAKSFKKQFDSSLFSEYRLIAMDLSGHGESSKAKNPEKEYSFQGLISTLLEFVDKLKLDNAVFVGHSLGGNMLLSGSTNLPEARGFVLFGAPPIAVPPQMEKYFLPNPVFPLAYKPDLNDDEIIALASNFTIKKDVISNIVNEIKRTDPQLRAYLGASIVTGGFKCQVEIIENLHKPIAIFHGENDPLVNGDYYKELKIPVLWKNQVQIVSHAGHSPQLDNPDEFNDLLKSFLDQIC